MDDAPILPTILTTLLIALFCLGGCAHRPSEDAAGKGTAENPVVWLEKGLEVEGMTIDLGRREGPVKAGEPLEPVAAISKDGQPVADAMVFAQLVSGDGQTTVGSEAATVYQPASGGTPACYAGGKLQWPAEVGPIGIRFRIVFASVDKDWTKDVAIPDSSTSGSQ